MKCGSACAKPSALTILTLQRKPQLQSRREDPPYTGPQDRDWDMVNNWDLMLWSVTFAYNISIHASTIFSPFELMFSRIPVFPMDLVFPLPEQEGNSLRQYTEDRVYKIQQMYARIQEVKSNVMQRTARIYNPHGAQRLDVGSWVWSFKPQL